jgi:hypothetical protein
MKIEEALFRNRDENSFTARLFEGYVFPKCYDEKDKKSKTFFRDLIQRINNGTDRCEEFSKLKPLNIPSDDLEFIDGMLFVECIDLFAANKGKSKDKTEFDAIIIAKNKNDEKKILLIFEIKCYSDLTCKEIKRQQARLNALEKLYQDFNYFHIALISEDNLTHAGMVYQKIGTAVTKIQINNFAIISWKDILGDFTNGGLTDREYILQKRITPTSRLLPKKIPKKANKTQLSQRILF